MGVLSKFQVNQEININSSSSLAYQSSHVITKHRPHTWFSSFLCSLQLLFLCLWWLLCLEKSVNFPSIPSPKLSLNITSRIRVIQATESCACLLPLFHSNCPQLHCSGFPLLCKDVYITFMSHSMVFVVSASQNTE